MKVNIVIIAETILWLVLGAVATFALLTLLKFCFCPQLTLPTEKKWKNWGAAPYAASQEEACRKTSLAIDGFNMPPTVKEHFKTELGATCKGRQRGVILPHELLEQMWSGPTRHKGPHLMNRAAVEELPVAKSPMVVRTVARVRWSKRRRHSNGHSSTKGRRTFVPPPTSASTGAGPMVLRRSRS